MSNKHTHQSEIGIALAYIRLSFTRNGEDELSPERQRENIQTMCQRHGWVPEWYEDVEGHKSGRHVENRPAWQALEARLGDKDVVAIIANDLARLHRKGWRIGQLVDHVDKCGVALVLAEPGREIDTSTTQGRMLIQFIAMADEWYAEDIAMRARSSIRRRKEKGITIGIPPFGTIRDDNGFLIPREDGVWLLSDGTWRVGEAEMPPDENAIWRGYYDCAYKMLNLYANENLGPQRISERLNDEGWAFCDRYGNPRRVKKDDARRVIASVYTYGGIVSNGS